MDQPLPIENRPKKRTRNPENWKQKAITKRKAAGLEHRRHHTNEVVPARQRRNEICIHNCHVKMSEEEKEWVFRKFNGYSSHVTQNAYLQGCAVPLENRRFDYICQLPSRIEIVCQKVFLAIHGIKRSRLQRKVLNRNVSILEGRGKHENHKKIPINLVRMVKDYIENLDARSSHYSQNDNVHKIFLESHSTMTSLYKNMLEEMPRLNPNLHPDGIKLHKFVHIFNYQYNIGFGKPRSDICETCEIINVNIKKAEAEDDQDELFTWLLHQQDHWIDANEFFKKMASVIINLTDDDHFYICFDFMKNLPLPITNVTKEYYLRQLWIYVFGIRNLKTKETHFFTYCEHYGKKGSSEVVSFVKYYIENIVPQNVKHLHLFCDNSFGQNKNRFLMAYLSSICPSRFDTISFDFPIPGHSRMLIDSDFSHIEKRKRKEEKFYFPSQWISLMRNARPSMPFNIIYVQHPVTDDMEEDGTPLCSIYNFKQTISPLIRPAEGQIANLRQLKYSANGILSSNSMQGQEYSAFQILKRGITAARLQEVIMNTPVAYEGYLPITAEKYANLQVLLRTFNIPPEKSFYTMIPVVGNEAIVEPVQ